MSTSVTRLAATVAAPAQTKGNRSAEPRRFELGHGAASCGRLRGLGQVLRFNAPLYVAGGLVVLASSLAWTAWLHSPAGGPFALVWLAIAVAGMPAAFWMVVSALTTWWTYDVSALNRWTWLAPRLPFPPRQWTVIHAGLDEASVPLARLFPRGEGRSLDIFDPSQMTEPSIARARREQRTIMTRTAGAGPVAAFAVDAASLPIVDDGVEAHFLFMAAHELRAPAARERLFTELNRTLRPGGVVVLVEHLRDGWNTLAYGPGAWHFFAAREWRRLAAGQLWERYEEAPLTPWVRLFIWRKPQYAPLGAGTMARYAASRSADQVRGRADSRTGQRQAIAALHLFDGPG